jgi:hypothetical protein
MTEANGFSSSPPAVSLDLELATLSGATRGAQLLAELLAQQGLDEASEQDAPMGILCILALVRERLSLARRVVRDEEDPAQLRAPHNTVEDPSATGTFTGDIVLFSWGSLRSPMVMRGARKAGAERWRRAQGRKPKGRKETAPVSSSIPAEESQAPGSFDPAPP